MNTWDYVEGGFVDDGYLSTSRPVVLEFGGTRTELRGPSSRSGSVRLLQAEEVSTGWARYGFTPIATVHTLTLEYDQMRSDDYEALVDFRASVDDTAQEFTFSDSLIGALITARFASPEQAYEEASFNLFKTIVVLQSLSPFIPYPSAPPADIAAILTEFHYPYKVTIARKQPFSWMSDGTLRVANKSSIKRHLHGLTLVRKSAADLGNLFSYFQHVAVGIRNKWPWTLDGVSHQVRFSESKLEWKQSQVRRNLFDLDLTLEEDA